MFVRQTLLRKPSRLLASPSQLRTIGSTAANLTVAGAESLNDSASGDNSGGARPPLVQLSNRLNDELQKTGDADKVYSDFKNSILEFRERDNADRRLQSSNSLTSLISQLLRVSISSSNESKLEPYEILNNICDSNLARPQHFRIVMEYFLSKGKIKDVMSLWVKYLMLITQNPSLVANRASVVGGPLNPHTGIVALTTVAYLALPDNTPDIKTLYELLQFKDTPTRRDQLPIKLVGTFIHQKIPESERATTSKNYSILFNQFINKNSAWLDREITNACDLKTLSGLYDPIREAISFSSAVSFSPEVIVQFMDKFNEIGRPEVAIRVYSDFKPVFMEDEVAMGLLNRHLLETVSRLPANAREYRLKRVQAVWNTLFKGAEPIPEEAYASLLKSLSLCQNSEELQEFWETEIPDEARAEQCVKEAYFEAVLRTNRKVTVQEIQQRLPDKIKSLDLLNAVLRNLVRQKQFDIKLFEEYYSRYFESVPEVSGDNASKIRIKPNAETFGIRMLALYLVHQGKGTGQFEFLKSIGVDKDRNFGKVLAIVESFVSASPSVEPVRQLYGELKKSADSRLYKIFIEAEFTKKGGSSAHAEALLEEYITDAGVSSGTANKSEIRALFLKEVLDTLMAGFCALARREQNPLYIRKLKEYSAVYAEINTKPSVATLSKILSTVSYLSAQKRTEFNSDDKQFIEEFLQGLSHDGFRANQQDLRRLRNNGLEVPSALIYTRSETADAPAEPNVSQEEGSVVGVVTEEDHHKLGDEQ